MSDDAHTPVTASDAAALEPEHLTDLGNARRLVHQFGQDIRHVRAWDEWLVWGGTHWQRDETGQVERFAKAVTQVVYREAGYEDDERQRGELARWAMQSESVRAIRGMVTLAQTEPGIPVPPAALDADPWLLNCSNGTLDLRTGTLREHRRGDLITKLVRVAYDPAAPCPMFEAFLRRIFADRPALIDFVQRAVGYSLTGDTREQVIFLCWGTGANGKTTLIQALATILADYASTLAAETLLAKKGDRTLVMNDLASLQGARFAIAVESDMGRRLAEALVKQLTGGEDIKVKRLYANVYPISPTFKLWIGTNHKPVIRGTDHAIWRRIRLLPFDVVIPDEEQDHTLREKLQAERAGILRWAVEGCLAWQRQGLGAPDEIRQATKDYQAEMDSLANFIAECCILEREAAVSVRDLYERYSSWATTDGESVMSKTDLGRVLSERGLERGRTGRARGWKGIRVRTPADPDGDAVTDDDTNSGNFSQPTRVGKSFKIMRHSPSPVTNPEPDGFVSDIFDPPEGAR